MVLAREIKVVRDKLRLQLLMESQREIASHCSVLHVSNELSSPGSLREMSQIMQCKFTFWLLRECQSTCQLVEKARG